MLHGFQYQVLKWKLVYPNLDSNLSTCSSEEKKKLWKMIFQSSVIKYSLGNVGFTHGCPLLWKNAPLITAGVNLYYIIFTRTYVCELKSEQVHK